MKQVSFIRVFVSVFGSMFLLLPSLASAATISVNADGDARMAGDGACEFSEAIMNANIGDDISGGDCVSGSEGSDNIVFRFGAGAHTITLVSQLPEIVSEIHIDGLDRSGEEDLKCSPKNLKVSLNGNGNIEYGLSFQDVKSDRSSVRGMNIYGMTEAAIFVGGDFITVTCNTLGTNAEGNLPAPVPNSNYGIFLRDSDFSVIGEAGAGNTVSANGNTGIFMVDSSDNTIQGNVIGTDASGTTSLGNHWNGIALTTSGRNLIGGDEEGQANLISANEGSGIVLNGSYHNFIKGNKIGTDADGKISLGNQKSGIRINAGGSFNLIGGSTVGEGNLVSGNGQNGIWIMEGDKNLIQGNTIGTDVSGTLSLPNRGSGVLISGNEGTREGNVIGGSDFSSESNLISGNEGYGVHLKNTKDTRVDKNLIGFGSDGVRYLKNGTGMIAASEPKLVFGGERNFGAVQQTDRNVMVAKVLGVRASRWSQLFEFGRLRGLVSAVVSGLIGL